MYFRSPGFDTNDLGFLRRADQIRQGHWLQLRSNKVTRWFRQRTINFNQWTSWNFDGNLQFGGANVNGNVTFLNNWQWRRHVPRRCRVAGSTIASTRGGPGLDLPQTVPSSGSGSIRTTAGGLSAGFEGGLGRRQSHSTSWQSWYPSITVRPVPAIMFSLGVQSTRTITDSQWVNNITDTKTHYVFAPSRSDDGATDGRFNYTITPNLSVQLYAQPFVVGRLVQRRSRK